MGEYTRVFGRVQNKGGSGGDGVGGRTFGLKVDLWMKLV